MGGEGRDQATSLFPSTEQHLLEKNKVHRHETWCFKVVDLVLKMHKNSATSICSSKKFFRLAITRHERRRRTEGEEGRGGEGRGGDTYRRFPFSVLFHNLKSTNNLKTMRVERELSKEHV
jgi:hypothetical protein